MASDPQQGFLPGGGIVRRNLVIDGGGIKGVVPASFLSHLEEVLPDTIAGYFDLVVGTSTGGIIALGLGLGLSANEILSFYANRGPKIFCGNPGLRAFRRWFRAKYDPQPLRSACGSWATIRSWRFEHRSI